MGARSFIRRLQYLLRFRRADAELAEELELHRQLLEQDLERQGLTATQAASAARRQFGSGALARDRARDVWLAAWLRDLGQDLRFAFRVLAKDRRFTIAAVTALALGIGLTNSVFAIVNVALIRQLPFDGAARLVSLQVHERGGRAVGLSYAELREWQQSSSSFMGIGAAVDGTMNVSDSGGAPERLRGAYVSANAFALLRVAPVLGRDFGPDDEQRDAPPVVILGYDVWQRRYGGAPSVIGQTVRVNAVPTVVIGVMPARFKFPSISEVWQPMTASRAIVSAPREARTIGGAFARLKDGVGLAAASAELETVVARLDRQNPGTGPRHTGVVVWLRDSYGGTQIRGTLYAFLGAVAFVLLIACANVANLTLARASARAREMAIRASLGATRWRIVRQMLVECVVIAAAAAAVGLLLSFYGAKQISVAFDPIQPGAAPGTLTPYWVNLTPDAVVFGFAALLGLGASLAFGLVPALHVARSDLNDVIRNEGQGSERGIRRWSGTFIMAELALTVILLSAASLLGRSFYSAYRADMVIPTADLVAMRVVLPGQKYDTAEKRLTFFRQLEERLSTAPQITSVTLANIAPLAMGGPALSREMEIDGRSPAAGQEPRVSYVYASTSYFDTLRVPLVRGRLFTDDDRLTGREGAVVDERFAATFFRDGNVVGQRIRLKNTVPGGASSPWLTVVGVVRTVPSFAARLARPMVYAPIDVEPAPQPAVAIVARSQSDLAVVVPELRSRVRALDADLPLFDIQSLDDAVAQVRLPQRLFGSWFAIIAGVALLLAAVGVYGLTARGVAQRTREIGVRMAIGASAAQVVALFLRRTVVHIAVGLFIGLAGALMLGQLLQGFLVDTAPRDSIALSAAALVLAIVGMTASIVPARRAARLDPVTALRHE